MISFRNCHQALATWGWVLSSTRRVPGPTAPAQGPGGLDKRSEDFILMPNGTQCAVAHPVKVCQSLLRFGSSDHHWPTTKLVMLMLQSLRVNLLLSMKSPAQTPQCQAVKSISDCLARDIHTNVLHALKMLGEAANLAIVHNDVSSWRSWTLTLTLFRGLGIISCYQ